jgi:hypothetical protein
VDLALFDVGQQFDALRDELIALGATEEELIRLAQLRAEAEQRVIQVERERAARELADLMDGVETAIFELTRSEFRVALRELGQDMAELRARAIELGASEEQLGRIRQLEILRQNAILADAQARLVDLAATFLGTTEQAAAAETSRINDIRERMEERYRREVAALERIGELVDSLLLSSLSPLTPREQEAEARRQLNAAFAAAEAGDIDALESLPGLVQQFLQILQTNTGGVGAFPAEFQAVLDRLASIEADGPQTRPPSQRPPTAADVDSAAGSITAGLEALERAQLASQIIDIMGFVAQRTGETPSEIADRLGLPLDDLIEAVSGELPEATGEALRSFFDELVLEADRQLSELVGIQETLTADAAVRERISNLTKDSLAELRKITALLEAAAIAPGFIPEQPGPTSVPGFADGGFASGLIMTGERGRELVLPNPVTEFFVRNGIPIQPSSGVADRQLVEEIRGLRADIQAGNVERSRQSTILQVGNRNLAAAINSAKSERDRNRFIGQPSRGGSTCGSV